MKNQLKAKGNKGTGKKMKTFVLDTTKGSVLHQLTGYFPSLNDNITIIILISVIITYFPLLLSAVAGQSSVWQITDSIKLPFLRDWNVMFMFLVSFPTIIIFIISDDKVLQNALNQVKKDGVVSLVSLASKTLINKWEGIFKKVNIFAQLFGIAIGTYIARLNFLAYSHSTIGYWITSDEGKLFPSGWIYLYCIFLFFTMLAIFFIRSLTFSFFLRDLTNKEQINMSPVHPDKCGGLSPVGRIGLRNQCLLTFLATNILLLIFVSFYYLEVSYMLKALIVSAGVGYILLGPIVFFGPLLPFRNAMIRTKTKLMGQIAKRLRIELKKIQNMLNNGLISKEDEEFIDRLRKIGSVIDELPVWPFDAGTLKHFLSAYIIPILTAIIFPLGKMLFDIILEKLS